MSRWLRARRSLLASEDGVAMVVALFLIVIGLAAAAAALSEAIDARTHANRTARSARALQAADAGVQAELYRTNQLNLGALKLTSGASLSSIITQLLTCPVPQINSSGQVIGLQFTAIASVGSPCPTNSSSGITNPLGNEEPLGHHSFYEAQLFPGTTALGDFIEFSPKIVASGVDDDGSTKISRRVEAILAPYMPWRTLEAASNLTINVPSFLSALGQSVGGTTTLNGTLATDGNLSINGNSVLLGVNTFQAANISLSGGLTEPSALDYCGSYTQSNITLSLIAGNKTLVTPCNGLVSRPAIQISSTKPACPSSCAGLTGYTTLNGGPQILINNGSSISFSPGDYVFCSFQSNGPVNINPTWPPSSGLGAVRIFIDNPHSSRCSGYTGSNPGSFIASKGVTNTLAATDPSQAQVYVVGNGSPGGTTVTSTATGLAAGQGMFLYAPQSNVTVSALPSCVLNVCTGLGTLAGAYVGNTLTVSASTITQDLGVLNYPLSSSLGPFYIKQYIECTPQYPLPSPDPTSGC